MGETALYFPFRLSCILGCIKFSLISLLGYPQERGLENGVLDMKKNSSHGADGLKDGMGLRKLRE